MSGNLYQPAQQPTLYFIGVTTGKSSIMKVFPAWAQYLGLRDSVIKGFDFVPHDAPERYREAVAFLKSDPLSLGALVTTHKIDLLHACRDQFDGLDPYAQLMGEVSCLSKRQGQLFGHAKDPISSGLALEAFLPPGYWERTGAEVLVLGAGGSAIAITSYLVRTDHGANRPSRIVVTNRSRPRLHEIEAIHRRAGTDVPIEFHHAPTPDLNDRLLGSLRPQSLVINATGLGKDAPGSPLTSAAVFPEQGWVWEFNYRGDLLFLEQARAQQAARRLHLEDGWIYFVHGWTQVIAEVFHLEIPTAGPVFDELGRLAARART